VTRIPRENGAARRGWRGAILPQACADRCRHCARCARFSHARQARRTVPLASAIPRLDGNACAMGAAGQATLFQVVRGQRTDVPCPGQTACATQTRPDELPRRSPRARRRRRCMMMRKSAQEPLDSGAALDGLPGGRVRDPRAACRATSRE